MVKIYKMQSIIKIYLFWRIFESVLAREGPAVEVGEFLGEFCSELCLLLLIVSGVEDWLVTVTQNSS